MKLNIVTLVLVTVGMVLFAMHISRLPWTVPRIAGIAIALPSFLLLAVARMQLGRAFSVRAKAVTLVTNGLYSRIRNPIYFFGALVFLGIIIWTAQPWLLFFLVVLIPLQMHRSRTEERVLTEKFGTAYLDYKKKTWF
ncbi:MAG: isoprenylcysteine carboxylmethyltransferase family protein [Terracidiphilus sp.]